MQKYLLTSATLTFAHFDDKMLKISKVDFLPPDRKNAKFFAFANTSSGHR